MNIYLNKYKKYKKKYILLNNQIGGDIFDLSKWHKIENNGEENCGIFISCEYPNYIMKCTTNDQQKYMTTVNLINSIVKIFPLVIGYKNIDGKYYTIMEKMDGDIIYFFNIVLVNQVLDEWIELDTEKKNKLFKIYKYKSIFFNSFKNIEEIKNFFIENKLDNITKKIYDEFMIKICEKYDKYYKKIKNEVIKLLIKLKSLKYFNYDLKKFDNFGYILSDNVIEEDYRKSNVPIFFGKYFYIIDWGNNSIQKQLLKEDVEQTYNLVDYVDNYDGKPDKKTIEKIFEHFDGDIVELIKKNEVQQKNNEEDQQIIKYYNENRFYNGSYLFKIIGKNIILLADIFEEIKNNEIKNIIISDYNYDLEKYKSNAENVEGVIMDILYN
jgi:hypothetical protein